MKNKVLYSALGVIALSSMCTYFSADASTDINDIEVAQVEEIKDTEGDVEAQRFGFVVAGARELVRMSCGILDNNSLEELSSLELVFDK